MHSQALPNTFAGCSQERPAGTGWCWSFQSLPWFGGMQEGPAATLGKTWKLASPLIPSPHKEHKGLSHGLKQKSCLHCCWNKVRKNSTLRGTVLTEPQDSIPIPLKVSYHSLQEGPAANTSQGLVATERRGRNSKKRPVPKTWPQGTYLRLRLN